MNHEISQMSDKLLNEAIAEEVLGWPSICRCNDQSLNDIEVESGKLKHKPCCGFVVSNYSRQWVSTGEVISTLQGLAESEDPDDPPGQSSVWRRFVESLKEYVPETQFGEFDFAYFTLDTRVIAESALSAIRSINKETK